MSDWRELKYLGDSFKPFTIRLAYCDEEINLREIYKYDDDEEWIDKTAQQIADGDKYFVVLRAKAYLAGVEVGSHSLGGMLFDNTDEMESMMKMDYEGIIAEAVDNAKHNLKQISEAMSEATA